MFRLKEMDLDSQIRNIKRRLFENRTATVELRPNFSGTLDLGDLLTDTKMQKDGEELLRVRKEIVAKLFTQEDLDAIRLATDGRPYQIHVLLTGGSASVPIIQALSTGQIDLVGAKFRFTAVEQLPDWIEQLPRESAQLLASVYPQCAVAIGGSVPKLPEEYRDLEIPVTPPPKGPRRLPRFPITGN
jgi:hypothetical protein